MDTFRKILRIPQRRNQPTKFEQLLGIDEEKWNQKSEVQILQ